MISYNFYGSRIQIGHFRMAVPILLWLGAQWISKDSLRKWQITKKRNLSVHLRSSGGWICSDWMQGPRVCSQDTFSFSSGLPLYFGPTFCAVVFILRQAFSRGSLRGQYQLEAYSPGLASSIDQLSLCLWLQNTYKTDTCLSHFQLPQQNTTVWLVYKQLKFISYRSRGWKSKIMMPAHLVCLVRAYFLISRRRFLGVYSPGRTGKGSRGGWNLFYRNASSIHDISTFQMSRVQIPSLRVRISFF